MKKNFRIVLALLFVIVHIFSVRLAFAQTVLKDIENHQNRGAIQYLFYQKIVSGYPDGTFRPNNNINRAELLKILVGSRNIKIDSGLYKDCFPDVRREWFAPYVCFARVQGWIQGYPDGFFRPGQFVNKAEGIKMIVNVRGYPVNSFIVQTAYTDVRPYDWFSPFVVIAHKEGLLEEYGSDLNPGAFMTRAAASESIFRSIVFQETFVNLLPPPVGLTGGPSNNPFQPTIASEGNGGGDSGGSSFVPSSNTSNTSGSSNPFFSPAQEAPITSSTPSPSTSSSLAPAPSPSTVLTAFEPRGLGGGGAMAGYSVNPWNTALRFVGTDMGTLFRSTDSGKTWRPVDHNQARFYGLLEYAAPVGFNPDPKVVFYASGGRFPQRSADAGVIFQSMKIPLQTDERIKYFISNSKDGNIVFAATDKGFFRSSDRGVNWSRVSDINGFAKGTVVMGQSVYHATSEKIYRSDNNGVSFAVFHTPERPPIRSFSGGSKTAMTLAYIDTNLDAASLVGASPATDSVGYVWTYRNDTGWKKTNQPGGDFVGMAENDDQAIYVTGSSGWPNAYGTKVWVSRDAGKTWNLKLHQYNWDVNPFQPWPKMEYSGVGFDVGWWDNGYHTFHVNQLNSAIAGGSQNFFLFSTENFGDFWDAPVGDYAGTGTPGQGERWKSQGLEVSGVRYVKFHPKDPNVLYAGSTDIGGYISEDHGDSWRIARPVGVNTVYDFAFDPADSNVLYVATGAEHDWPFATHEGLRNSTEGAIYKSLDRGRTWKQLTPSISQNFRLGVQYLSIAYDAAHKILYAGRQGFGLIRSRDDGQTWEEINDGIDGTDNWIVPQIEIDPAHQDVYVLLSGDFPNFTNQAVTGIYKFDFDPAAPTKKPVWKRLRGTIATPVDDWADDGIDAGRTLDATPNDKPWWYPVSFAVDWNDATRKTLYLGDKEVNGAYMWSGLWKSTDGGTNWSRLKYWQNVVDVYVSSGRVYTAADDWDDQDISIKKKWGLWYSDNGSTWNAVSQLPLRHNVFGIVGDPSDAGKIWVSFFGGGIMVGPKP